MEEFYISELISDRNRNNEDNKEKQCYDILDSLNIKYERVEYNFFPKEINDLIKIDNKLGVKGIKNLIFKTKNNEQYFFIILFREDRFDDKLFRSKYNLPKICMANVNELNDLLDTHSGAVSIMELVNDKNNKIKLYIDERVLNEEYFRFHPNENKSTVRISMDDFKNKLIPFLKHDINVL